jgi:hypothetical protein
MNKLYMLCAAFVLILLVVMGLAAPAMVSASNSLAVLGGVVLVGVTVYVLVIIGKMIIDEINRGEK